MGTELCLVYLWSLESWRRHKPALESRSISNSRELDGKAVQANGKTHDSGHLRSSEWLVALKIW